jgi:hypothetical protein
MPEDRIMDRGKVIEILEALAYGKDPATGSALDIETFRSAENVRALFTAVTVLREAGQKQAVRRSNSATFASAGAPWSKHEDARVCQEFDQGMSAAQIGLLHGRSSRAIRMRLVKLGRIDRQAAANSTGDAVKAAS